MAKHLETGILGESIAVEHLKDQGYIILEINWRYRRSEVDIICTKGGVLIFVEVKTRNGISGIHPALSVSAKKEAMLKAAAAQYMLENEYEWAMRFDIISVILHDTDHELEHFEDAFW